MATRWRSHRLFDLLILAPELLGLVDPLTLVLWQSLQVQLQTASAQVSVCDLNKKLHKQAETRLSVSTKEGLQAARTAVFSAAGKIAKATLIKPNRTSWSIWQLPSSIRFESGCSSVGRWCLPAGSWPGNYCWGTSRPILSCAGEGRQRTGRFMSSSTKIGHSIPSNVSSSCKAGGWSSELGQAHEKRLTCMRERLTEAVSKFCCQEILLVKQTQAQGVDVNNQPQGVKLELIDHKQKHYLWQQP